jgi:site-specific DNA recombinase
MRAALYARFSTDKQSEASIDDQHRVCERIADRHGFAVTARFSDRAISGGTTSRPGYQQLLAAARRGEFDVIVAEDTSRLWRNLAEQSPRLAELSDMGCAVVTHDLDTRQESATIMGAVGGAMAEQYRREIGRRTRRGLEGLARKAKPTGGRSFGYRAANESGTGQVEIDEAQAVIVRRIFRDFAEGLSAKAIATALNRERVPPPGSSWNRVASSRGWVTSAIAGDSKRGLGILNNELYLGRVIWNRFRWVRSAADSSKRKCIPNAKAEWIVRDESRLRIVTDEVWKSAKAKQRQRQHVIGERISAGIAKGNAGRTGRGPRYLFSGLLRCSHCGANMVMANATGYACASRVNAGTCGNDAYVNRVAVEEGLLAGIQRELLRPELVDLARRRIVAALRKRKQTIQPSSAARIEQLQREVDSLVESVAGGALRASPAIAHRLAGAEAELLKLQERPQDEPRADAAVFQTSVIVDRYLASVRRLPETLAKADVERSRAHLRELMGMIEVEADAKEIRFRAESGAVEGGLQRLAGTGQQISLVAGVGFEPTTFGL